MRRGTTFIELLITISMLGLLFEITITGMELLDVRAVDNASSSHVDLVTERLRAELRLGFTITNDALVTTSHRWAVQDGQLQRDGITQCAATWTLVPLPMGTQIILQPNGCRERRLFVSKPKVAEHDPGTLP